MHDHTQPPPNNAYKSTDDQRTEVGNETRHQYRKLTDGEQLSMEKIKDLGQLFIGHCKSRRSANDQSAREYSIAIRRMEEAVMWAVKGLTK